MLRTITIAVVAICFSGGAFAADRGRPRHAPAATHKADRLSSQESQSNLNIPGQVTILTREILDDKNATSLRDALNTTAGVTVGR